jgi:hypothetical protein
MLHISHSQILVYQCKIFCFQDELARVFVTLFDAKHLLSPLLWNMFYREVEVSDCMQTLFRGNSLGSKIMAFCFKIYGASYLQNLLEPLIRPLLEESNQSFEVDPARLVFVFLIEYSHYIAFFSPYQAMCSLKVLLHAGKSTRF